ncbi:uncharacterized protein LOC110881480 [Helianthus annuus]|uniref:uncharacterized protein LOC110881480 n=1 Tax=Helianthus annuus TaxID=4232 RepID=UPI000B8F8A13|nr:uncharacterized protein LOC110881480 [Helianthus annuus]
MGLDEIGDFDFASNVHLKNVESKVDPVMDENKRLAVENKKVADREKILEMRVKKLESENKSLLKKIDTDQTEIDLLRNKELEAAKALKEHKFYMMNKVIESMLGKSIEQRFEEIQVEEVRAKRHAEIEALMKDKGKGATDIVVDDEEDDSEEDDDEEGDEEEDDDDDEKVFSASSHGSGDDNDDDNQGGTGVTTTEASKEQNVDDLMKDDANEETEGADGEGEHGDDQNVDQVEKLILRLEPHVEEGEFRHTYTLSEILKITHVNENEFRFDFEEELNAFDINPQPEYEYKYVEDADMYDRVEVEDCTDEDILNEDTSELPTLMEFFSEEIGMNLEGKLLRFLKTRTLTVNAYAIRRECGVQYFEKLHDVMSFPWWDVDELSKVRTLGYPVRKNDIAMWGLIKFDALKDFKHWKPHYQKRVQRVDPVTGIEETILNVKKPKTMKNIPVPKMEQEFYKGFMGWMYSCISTEAVITYKAGKEISEIFVYGPMWLVNCSAKDIECLFINKIHFQSEDREQAMQFQKVATICFQKGINSECKWNSKWWSLEEKEKKKAKRERKKLDEYKGKWMKLQAEEEKKKTKENDRLRNLLRKKPKQREERFKSL